MVGSHATICRWSLVSHLDRLALLFENRRSHFPEILAEDLHPVGAREVGVEHLAEFGRVTAAWAVAAPHDPIGAEFLHRVFHLAGVRIGAGELEQHVLLRADDAHAELLTTQKNGGYAKVKGLEVSYNQQLTFLPGIWKGLGAFANATWMNARGNYGAGSAIALAPNPRVAGFNPFIANAGVSYIRSKLNLRASYNYRHRYLSSFNANESRAVYFAARPAVDVKTLYNVNRQFSVYLDVVNIFMRPDRETQFGYGRPQTTHLMRPQFFFGVNARM